MPELLGDRQIFIEAHLHFSYLNNGDSEQWIIEMCFEK